MTGKSWRSRWSGLVGAALLYAALAAAAQPDLLLRLRSHVYFQAMLGQDCLLHVYALAWDHHALATSPCHLFDANVFSPHRHTLLYSDHLIGLALVLAPLRLFTDDVVLVHNLATIAAPALDALALYALALDLTGRTSAALIAGLLYGFAPLRFAVDRCQIQMLAAWWLPLILLWGGRAVRGEGRRWGILAGLALAFQGLSGIYLTAFFLPFLALAHVAWWRRHPPRGRPGWGALLAAEAVAALVLLPSALAYRAVQAELGSSRSPFVNAILSFRLSTLPDLVAPWTLGLLLVAGIALRRRAPARFREDAGLLLAITGGALVLSLGPAISLPRDLGTVWGPYALLLPIPGFTALRVPGRVIHVALVGACTLAAGGFAAATARWSRPAVMALAGATLIAVALESRPPHVATIPVPPPRTLDRIYGWLATQPPTLHLVELPTDPFLLATAYRQYASTLHWKPMLDGTMGIFPPIHPYMQRELARFPDRDVVADLRALGITHVVVHLDKVTDADRARVVAAARERRLLKLRHRAGKTVAYALRPGLRSPPRRPRGHPLDRHGWRVEASHSAGDAALAVDDDPRTYWNSWGDLARGLGDWYSPVSLLDRWQRFLDHQPVRLTVDLGTVVPVSAVLLRLGGSDPFVESTLESSLDGQTWVPLPARLEPLPDVRAFVDHAAELPAGVLLAPAVPARFVRASADPLEWHVSDFQVYVE